MQIGRVFEVANADAARKYAVTASYIEIYNNEINDLLGQQPEAADKPSSSAWSAAASGRSGSHAAPRANRRKIAICYATGQGDITFTGGLSEERIASREQAEALLALGDERRKTAATKMNDRSSRSHAVLLVRITSCPTSGARNISPHPTLW